MVAANMRIKKTNTILGSAVLLGGVTFLYLFLHDGNGGSTNELYANPEAQKVGTSSVNSEESECHMMVPFGYRNLMSNFTCWLRYVPKVRCRTVPVPVRAYELFKPAFKQFKR